MNFDDLKPLQEYLVVIEDTILNSYDFSRVYCFCFLKLKEKHSPFTNSECAKLLKMDELKSWKYLKKLITAGFLKKIVSRGSAKNTNSHLYIPQQKHFNNKVFFEKVELKIKGGI